MRSNPQSIESYHKHNPFIRSSTKFKMLLEALDPKLSHIALDAGCGAGNFDVPLSHLVKEIIGVDTSCQALRVANKYRNLSRKNNVHYVVADLSQLPFKSERFNSAFMIDVLEHIPSKPSTFLSDIHRTLKQNGVLFIYTATYSKFSLHYLESLLMGFRGRLWYADKEPKHLHRFLPAELAEVNSAGFKLKDMKFFGHVFEYLTSVLNRLVRYSVLGSQKEEEFSHSMSAVINTLYRLSAKVEQIDIALFGHFPSAGVFMTFLRT